MQNERNSPAKNGSNAAAPVATGVERSVDSVAGGMTVDELPKGVRPIGRLRILSGDNVGTTIEVSDPVILGSSASDASAVFSAPDVSPAHARIWTTAGGAFHVEDLRSRSGTYVNDIRVQRRALVMGDHIRLGGTVVLEFRF